MKKSWSSKWSSSVQTRKQRKYRYNAPLHVRHKFLSANLSPELRKQHEKRSIPIRKGDEVEVMVGDRKKMRGTVERIDMNSCKVYIEGFNTKKADGSEVLRPFEPSNLKITKIKLDDKMRQRVFKRSDEKSKAGGKSQKPEPAKKTPDKTAKKTKKKKEQKPAGSKK